MAGAERRLGWLAGVVTATPGPVEAPRDGVEVLHEDNHLLALNKPPALLTQDSGRGEDNLESRARHYLRESRNKPGEAFLHAVHRLDREASGVVLCATTSKALTRLNEQVRKRRVHKLYHAVVQPAPADDAAELVHWLAHADHRAVVTAPGGDDARECRLRYRVLWRDGGRALLEIDLQTGRYHQIRAQLAAVGCPILGDARYGGSADWAVGIALHHRRLQVEHPVRQQPLTIEAPYPSNWRAIEPTTNPR